jgi:hypothetical protein
VFLNAFRIRLALMGAGVLTTLVYVAMGGKLGLGSTGVIAIEYGAYPEAFQGLEVAIDGRAVGPLKPLGAHTRTAFEVKEGQHEVRVIATRFTCRPRRVNVESGSSVLLVLNVGESMPTTAAGKPEIVFQ